MLPASCGLCSLWLAAGACCLAPILAVTNPASLDSTPPCFMLARTYLPVAALWSHACVPLLLQWENHNKSLQLEAQTYQRIQEKIQERVMNNLGTWIDWQYLQNAAKLLAKVGTRGSFAAKGELAYQSALLQDSTGEGLWPGIALPNR